MNKTYRSIWNPSLGCYVAAPECAVAHAAGTSSQRVARATPLMRSKSVLALESRVLFDGAMLATAIEQDSAPPAPELPDAEIDEPVEAAATEETTQASSEPAAEDLAAAPGDTGADTATATDVAADADAAEEGDTTTPQAVEPAAAPSQEIVFVDGRVTDPAAFQSEGREVIVLALDQDGMSQIASALAGRTGIDAIHIVSHGSDGLLTLGSTEVTAASIQSTQLAYLQSIGQALSAEGDILIYACDYASGASGLEAMNLLADITGADVAASIDTTGHVLQGGDWTLEQTSGEVEAQALDLPTWEGELATYTGSDLASHLTLSGSATSVSSDTIRLTPNLGTQGGAVQSSFEIALNTDFSLSFSVYLGTSDAGADGVTFVMHNDPAGALAQGANGGGLGASGIADGVVIEFDTYNNGAPDLVNDHTSIWDSDSGEVLLAARDLGNIENGAWYPVTVTWTASTETLSYSFNGVSMGATSGLVSAGRFGSGETVHFGWTAATGGAMNEQQVRINSFTGELNFAPVAADDTVTIGEEGSSVLTGLLSNDSDPEGSALMITPVSFTGSNGGEISADDSGNLYFIPGASFDDLAVGQSRNTSFTYTLWDAQGASDTATVTITVQGANDAPVGVDDAFDADEDGGYSLGNPVANDIDPDSSWLYMSLNGLTGTNGGSFSADDSGNLIFIAGTDFDDLNVGETRQTSYTYTVNDGEGAQAAATVTVTVHGANDAPVGGDDVFTVLEDGEVSLGILTDNDLDADSADIFVDTSAAIAGDNGGVFSFDDSGNLSFNPGGDFNHLGDGESASTRFYYTLFDDLGASSMATVTVNILGVNDTPVAQDDSFAGFEDSAQSLGSVLANDSDVEGDELTVAAADVAGSGGGRFVVDGSMNLTFDPNGEFEDLQVGETRETSFTYAISDGHGGSAQAVVTVTVTGANDAPVAQDDHFDVDNQAASSLGSLAPNDSDVDGDELTLEPILSGVGSNGGIFGSDDSGCLSFDPAGAFDDLAIGDTRDTSFSYTISDGQGGLSSATVTVTVHGAEVVEQQQIAMVEAPSYPNEVVFVDARIPDPQAFAIAGRELVVLTLDEDGLAQIAAVLAGRSGVETIHIVSHGGDGYLTLGNGTVDASSFQSYQLPSLDTMAQALSANGDILIYACDFASGSEGQNTLQLLAQYTLADVAASLGTTGHETLNGNWSLEMTVGSVEAVALAPAGWVHTLNLGSAPVAQDAGEAGVQSPAAQPTVAAAVEVAAPVSVGAVARPDGSADVTGFETLGAARVVSLEDVFRQTLTPFLTGRADAPALADSGAALPWAVSSIDTGTDTVAATVSAPLAGWLPTLESLDDSLVDEAAATADPLELPSVDVDALQVPRQQAAPGFAAQLARWSQWTAQRPITRALARA